MEVHLLGYKKGCKTSAVEERHALRENPACRETCVGSPACREACVGASSACRGMREHVNHKLGIA